MVKFSMGNVLKLPQLLKVPELVSKSSIFRFWCTGVLVYWCTVHSTVLVYCTGCNSY
jgi:hypothetical protein